VPVDISFRDELPKTIIGKVLRRQLAAEEPEVTIAPPPRAA
jgi:acyl-coenzyme A synthetase/AMP-(fatty) acid ligase